MTTLTADVLLDNPLLVKHLRSRLRVGQMIPWLCVVVILCLCIVWAGQAFGIYANGTALAIILGLEVLILAFAGAQQVGGAVGGARESGILDFHRVSPQPPSWMALGFFLGAPAREYVLFLATVPFALLVAWLSPAGILGLFGLWVVMLFGSWIIHAIALLSALVSKRPKGANRGGMVGIMMLGIFLAQPLGSGIFFASTSLQEGVTIPFYGLSLPWLLFVLLFELVPLGFLLLAACRKMRADSAHVYTKAEAVACMATFTTLLLGAFWSYPDADFLTVIMVYAQTLLACVLVSTVTPSQAEYVRGLRRAFHQGRRRPSPWSDEGTNQVVTCLLAALVFLGSMALYEVLVDGQVSGQGVTSYPVAVGVLVAAYFGFALQYFVLRLPKSGGTYMAFFIFLAWLIPLLIGSIALGSGTNQGLSQVVISLSPLAGVTLTSGLLNEPIAEAARFAVIAPACGFAFVFAFLLIGVQRRIDRVVKASAGLIKKPAGPFDYLDDEGRESSVPPSGSQDSGPAQGMESP